MFIFSVSTFPSSPFLSLSHNSNNPWITRNNIGGSKGSQINAWKTHMKMSTKEIRGPQCTFCPNPPKDYHTSVTFYTQPHRDIGEGKGSWLKASGIIMGTHRRILHLNWRQLWKPRILRGRHSLLMLAAAWWKSCLSGWRHRFGIRKIFVSSHILFQYILKKQC